MKKYSLIGLWFLMLCPFSNASGQTLTHHDEKETKCGHLFEKRSSRHREKPGERRDATHKQHHDDSMSVDAESLTQGNLPEARHSEVYRDGFFVSASAYDYTAIASEIVGDAATAYDKAMRLYLWLCRNISFDRNLELRTADRCWDERKAVCQGYCELFYRMAETQKLKVTLVNGLSKHREAEKAAEKHVWLSIKTEKGVILADPTWGAGKYVNTKFVRLHDPLIWFDTDPEVFVSTHFPQKKKHQHLPNPITEEEFNSLPYISPAIAP